jgi:hypothetical protein
MSAIGSVHGNRSAESRVARISCQATRFLVVGSDVAALSLVPLTLSALNGEKVESFLEHGIEYAVVQEAVWYGAMQWSSCT